MGAPILLLLGGVNCESAAVKYGEYPIKNVNVLIYGNAYTSHQIITLYLRGGYG